jgi:glycosyltransferase involved in cell wall biosynthesis
MSTSLTNDASPKILVATSFAPDIPGASSLLLYELLQGVPPDRVAWWSSVGTAPPHSAARVGHFRSGQMPRRLQPQVRFIETKSFLLEQFWVPWATAGLRAFIRQQKPDLLWLQVSSWATPVLHRAIPDLGIPWHITVHDFADSVGLVRSMGARRAARFQRMIEELYAGAVSRDVYMQETGDELERKTGCKADLVLRAGLEPEEFNYIRSKPFLAPQEKIRIGYAGTIIAEDTFARFIAALQLLRPKLPLPLEVNLFGIHSYRNRPWFDSSLIVEHGFLPEDEFDRRYSACHWGLIIMELDDSNPRYSRFTFPNKFTRSVAAGLPIISIGHPACTLIKLANKYRLGPVVTAMEPAAIAEALAPALSDFSEPPQLRAELLRCAETEFDGESNRRKLHQLFRAAGKKNA